MIEWFEKHPLVRILALVSTIFGGGAILLSGGKQLFFETRPEAPISEVRPEIPAVSGTICPFLWTGECIESNEAFRDEIESSGLIGREVDLSLEVQISPIDLRGKICDLDYDYSLATLDVIEVPNTSSSCLQSFFVAFPKGTLEAGRYNSIGGGSEHKITGRYMVTSGGFATGTVPPLAYTGLYSFKPVDEG